MASRAADSAHRRAMALNGGVDGGWNRAGRDGKRGAVNMAVGVATHLGHGIGKHVPADASPCLAGHAAWPRFVLQYR
jgi:hypothetical protein